MPEAITPAEQPSSLPSDAYRNKIFAKVDAAWGGKIGERGYANPYEVAARVFDGLYQPEQAAASMDEWAPRITGNTAQELYASAKAALIRPLQLAGQAPTRGEFVSAVANAILHDADVAATILPGAREQIKRLIENGDQPAAWSAGHPEHQHRKLGKTGLVDSVAIAAIVPPVEISTQWGDPINFPTAIAVDKTTAETFARVRAIAGNNQIIVADDRVNNLRKFTAAIPETRAAIWAPYGAHAKVELEKLQQGENSRLAADITSGRIIPIKSINRLTDKIAELRSLGILTNKPATVFLDYDDTISDNTRRRDLELTAVVDTILRNGWA